MFDAYYDSTRFSYIDSALIKTGQFNYRGASPIRKTGCFYSKYFNFYIDTSNGVNEDLPINEYSGRVLKVIADAGGKPFVYFKSLTSPTRSRPLIQLIENNGGIIKPFVHWCYNPNWYKYTWLKRKSLQQKSRQTKKSFAIGLAANLKPYYYPKPNATLKNVSWQDYEYFGLGSNKPTGLYKLTTRQNLHKQLETSNFSYYYTDKIPYRDYINKSLTWRTVLCLPGVGGSTQRIFDHGFLEQCLIIRRTTYDYGYSWKPYIPEIDFDAPDWELQLNGIINDYQLWGEKIRYYFEHFLNPQSIVELIQRGISTNPQAIDGSIIKTENTNITSN